MAACSFIEQTHFSVPTNLAAVNQHLEWNPHPRPRDDYHLFFQDDDDDPFQEKEPEPYITLDESLSFFRAHAASLKHYPVGRKLLDAEHPQWFHAITPEYWLKRADFYESEYKQILDQEYTRQSRSVTPEPDQPFLPPLSVLKEKGYETVDQRAKRRAIQLVQEIETFPAGAVCLQELKIDNAREDAAYWEEMSQRLYEVDEACKRDWWIDWLRKIEDMVASAQSSLSRNTVPPALSGVSCSTAGTASSSLITTSPTNVITASGLAGQSSPRGPNSGSPTRQATRRTVLSKSDIGGWGTPSESNGSVSGITHKISKEAQGTLVDEALG